jgi:DNA (cytosine-5)-methyltransferase 1
MRGYTACKIGEILKILNCYSGIGGNRKLWGDSHDITAVEFNPEIAEIYHDYYPQDKIVVGDAHQYLLEHYKDYNFIWSSPPCPTHSDIRRCGVHKGQCKAVYPDMALSQEIILLKHFAVGKFAVENVKSYYEPLIKPAGLLHRHYFWTNFKLENFKVKNKRKHSNITGNSMIYGYNLTKYKINNKRKLLRNMTDPELGLHILNLAMTGKGIETEQQSIFELI